MKISALTIDEKRERILSHLPQISGFPTLSAFAIKACSVLYSPSKDLASTAELLSHMPILALQCLKNADHCETSLEDAIEQIGRSQCASIIRRHGILTSLPDSTQGYSIAKFWSHCLTSAINARCLFDILKDRNHFTFTASEIQTAALLHNLGVIILEQYSPEFTREVVQYAIDSKCSIYMAENQIMGINHADVGASLMERWSLSELFIATARFHEEPEKSPVAFRQACRLVHIASHLYDGPPLTLAHHRQELFEEKAWEGLNADFKDVGKMTVNARNKLDQISQQLPIPNHG